MSGVMMIPRTEALRRAIGGTSDSLLLADFLFLEEWEREPGPPLGATLRAYQIRRANPVLAAEIHAEVLRGRPLTLIERAALLHPAVTLPRPSRARSRRI